jgi:DNA-binding NarL/FixJ family response regulator
MAKLTKTVKRVRVVVADDNKQVREMVVKLLAPDYEVIGTAADGAAAFEMVLLLEPEVVVLDITMPIMSGIEASTQLGIRGSNARRVFLTVHEDPDFIRAALTSGASSYVVKSQMATDLFVAVRSALDGHFFISPCCAMSEEPSGDSK